MKKHIQFFIFVYFCLSSVHIVAQQETDRDEVLIISSYNHESKYTYTFISNFINEYMKLDGKCLTVVESLACHSLDEQSLWFNRMKKILKKHPNPKFIILLGPEAWACYFSMPEEKYKKIPIACFRGQRYGATLNNRNIPCLQTEDTEKVKTVDFLKLSESFNVKFFRFYEYDIDSDCNLIKHLFPDTRNIVTISDNTYTGLSEKQIVRQTLQSSYPEMNIIEIDGSRINLKNALKRIAAIPEQSVSILCVWRLDKDNVIYMNNADYLFRKANSQLPVFSLTGTGMGYWCIGGSVPQYQEEIEKKLANYLYHFIDMGDENLPSNILCMSNGYSFDLKRIKEFNLKKKLLPENSFFYNENSHWKEFFHTYQWYLLLILLVISLLTIGFLASIRYSWHIRQLKNKLEEDKKNLQHSEYELRIAKEKAEESNRLKSAFISNMSHEIRTPLNAIVGFSTILEEEIKENKDLKEYVNIISYNSDLLLKLINDILDLSRLESGRQNFRFKKQDLVPTCENIVAGMQPNVRKEVQLTFRHPTTTIVAETDNIRLQQVLVNLIGNAAKFTKQGFILLNVEPDEEQKQWRFSVTDSGCGIPLEKQTAVFERFHKLNEFAQGTGLGLSICQITVDKLGGKIWIDPTYKEGARFIFTIPYEHRYEQES